MSLSPLNLIPTTNNRLLLLIFWSATILLPLIPRPPSIHRRFSPAPPVLLLWVLLTPVAISFVATNTLTTPFYFYWVPVVAPLQSPWTLDCPSEHSVDHINRRAKILLPSNGGLDGRMNGGLWSRLSAANRSRVANDRRARAEKNNNQGGEEGGEDRFSF